MQWSGGSTKWASLTREIADFIYIITWMYYLPIPAFPICSKQSTSICAGVSTLSLSIALNAVSKHVTCSIAFGFVAYFIISSVASIRKIHQLGWITWVGFGSIVAAVLTVVIGVTIPHRPAAAPQTGDFDQGFAPWPPAGTTFAAAFAAALAIFSSSANTSRFVCILGRKIEMKGY